MATLIASPGETIQLALIVTDGATGLFPRAQVFDESGSAVGGPINLSHVSGGLYRAPFVVPSGLKFVVRYDIFADVGYTVDLSSGPSASREKGEDHIVADTPIGSAADLQAAVWDALRSAHGLSGSFGEAVRVLLGSQAKANIRIDNMVYDVNGFLTTARIRIFPDQATAAASTPGGVSQGEIHTVTLTGAPDGTFSVLPTTVLGLLP